MSNAPQSTEIIAERVRFDIIAKTESGHELRAWTDGHDVRWKDDEGRSGTVPAMLFRLAAHQLAHYCEDVVCACDSEHRDDFLTHWEDSVSCPIDLAMAHPYWAQPDHDANHLRFGFASIASNMALDVQPNGLVPRRTDQEDALFEGWYKTFEGSWHPPKAALAAAFHAGMRRLKSSFGDGERTDPEWGDNQTRNPARGERTQ